MIHVAICDDTVADRKQAERLLSRESDRRLKVQGNFYVDSYGNAESLLKNPMRYDVYFVDMCLGTLTGIDVLKALNAKGFYTPVVLCCSKLNYREMEIPEELKKQVIFMDKPIDSAELANVIDTAQTLADEAETFIELREKEETHYLREEEILYCIQKGFYVYVTLTSGKVLHVHTGAENLYSQFGETYPMFVMSSPKVILNGRHVKKTGFRRLTMTDGRKFFAPGYVVRYVRKLLIELQ